MVAWMPGVWELVILACIGVLMLAPVAVVLVIVAVVSRHQRRQMSNPQLTPCPSCHNMVSIHAETCPKCGCPLGPSETT